MSDETPFRRLRIVMGRMAYERGIRGPYVLADYLAKWVQRNDFAGRVPGRNTWSDYYRGKSRPGPDAVELFVRALELTESKQKELARAYAFPRRAARGEGR